MKAQQIRENVLNMDAEKLKKLAERKRRRKERREKLRQLQLEQLEGMNDSNERQDGPTSEAFSDIGKTDNDSEKASKISQVLI